MHASKLHATRAVAICTSAIAACLAGGALASANESSSQHLSAKGQGYARAVSSGGERFLNAGQTVRLGRTGHFTFSASCTKDSGGQNVVTFDVIADTTAGLDGNAPAPAGNTVNIHTNSDALDGKEPGAFDQVGSASDSTEIANDGQEVDVFYNDGVNWPAGAGSQAHDCFAGYTGIRG